MAGTNESNGMALSPKHLVSVIVFSVGVGVTISNYIGLPENRETVATMAAEIRANRTLAHNAEEKAEEAVKAATGADATATAALTIGTESAKGVNTLRDDLREETFDIYTKQDHMHHLRDQQSRDTQQDRERNGLRRDVDRLMGG